ncbi:MAG: DMT family transporter [Firmicutes bacterium]|nr:DMT family transporter [Bacillota bacterium]
MRRVTAIFLLLLTAFFWGGTFVIVKGAVSTFDPFAFVSARFVVSFAFLLLLRWGEIRRLWKGHLASGIILGILLGAGFIFQTLGLEHTSASSSGLITGMNVVFVAILISATARKLPGRLTGLGVASATAGLFLVTWKGMPTMSWGDGLTLVCAIFFALHIVATERLASGKSAAVLTGIEFAVIACVSGLISLIVEGHGRIGPHIEAIISSPSLMAAILYCGIPAGALAFLFQTRAQQRVSSTETAICLSAEPVLAAAIAVGVGEDEFTWRIVISAILIFTGMVFSSLEGGHSEGRDTGYVAAARLSDS